MRSLRALLPLVASCLVLAGCPAQDAGDGKDVAELRTHLQKLLEDDGRRREQIAVLERRVSGLSEDLVLIRRMAADAGSAATAGASAAGAPADGATSLAAGGAPTAASAAAAAPGIKAYFETDEGRKVLAATLKSVQDQAERERFVRGMEIALASFAKEANLTEDQTKKMKDLLARTAPQIQEVWTSMRDQPADATPEARAQAREAAMAKVTDLRTSADAEVKAILSQTQYEQYQKRTQGPGFGGLGGGMGGGGFGPPGRRGGGN
jgi:hypothetical protein